MARLKLHLLGSFQATMNGQPLNGFRSSKARALLAYLMVEADRPHHRDSLAALLWGGSSAKSARLSLRVTLSNLRQILGPLAQSISVSDLGSGTNGVTSADHCLTITRQTVQTNTQCGYCWVDVTEFDALWAACQGHLHDGLSTCPACIQRLAQAVEHYRDDLLQDVILADSPEFDEWRLLQQETRHRQALIALAALTTYYTNQGRYDQAAHYARRQIALEPWHERAHRQLMIILAASGQRAAALAQYATCVQTLAIELGAEPDTQTKDLLAQIRAGGPDWLGAPRPAILRDSDQQVGLETRPSPLQESPAPTGPVPADPAAASSAQWSWLSTSDLHNMPLQLAPFFGRKAELERLAALLPDPDYRLLTLIGPGGVGKTRLALAAAELAMHSFAAGVWYVPLDHLAITPEWAGRQAAPSPDVAAIPDGALEAAIAHALQLPLSQSGSPRTQLLNYLRGRQILLILDGFEHLPSQATDLLLAMLRNVPHLTLLVTSRSSLNLQAEYAIRLDGLPVPQAPPSDQIQANLDDLKQQACIQLFAERAARRPVGFELDEVTLPTVIDICQQVDGLPLGIELAAAQIEQKSPDEIALALEQDLNTLSTSMIDLPARHRSLRAAYNGSWRQLTPRERNTLAQASVFLGNFSTTAAREIMEPGEGIDTSLSSLVDKSLLQQTTTGRYEMHALLRRYAREKLREDRSSAPFQTLHSRHYLAFVARRQPALFGPHPQIARAEIQQEWLNIQQAWRWASIRCDTAHLSASLPALAQFLDQQSLFQEGDNLLAESIEPLNRRADRKELDLQGRIWAARARLANGRGRARQAANHALHALSLAEETQNRDTEARARLYWGIALTRLGEQQPAHTQLDRALALALADGNLELQSAANIALGRVAFDRGAWSVSEQLFRQAQNLARSCDSWSNIALALLRLSDLAWEQGAPGKATRYATESLDLYRQLGDRKGIGDALNNLGLAAGMRGNYATAIQCFTENMAYAQEIGDQRGVGIAFNNLGYTAYLQKEYREAAYYFQEALSLARSAGIRHLQANTLATLGLVHTALGDCNTAWDYLRQGLQESAAFSMTPTTLNALVGVAWLRAESGDYERAAELLGLAIKHPALEADVREDTAAPVLTTLTQALPSDQLDAALARGRNADLDTVVAGVLDTIPLPSQAP